MTDFSQFYNRFGAIYQFDFSAEPVSRSWPDYRNYSLSYLCCKVIVCHAELLEKATDVLSSRLFIRLFKAALYPIQADAIDVGQVFYRQEINE